MLNLSSAHRRFLFGIILILILISVVALYQQYAQRMKAELIEGLIYFDIAPHENVAIAPGESVTFTAEGNFGTTTMPIDVNWSLGIGDNLGELSDCNEVKRCTFTAGDQGGIVELNADAEDGELHDSVQITVEDGELANPFSDELPEWAKEAILTLHQMDIVKGYEDGRYGPGDPVTRGQAVTLLHRILVHTGLIADQGCAQQAYSDVPADNYAYVPTCAFKQNNWSGGGNTFSPDASAPRGVTASFVNRVFGATLLNVMNLSIQQGQQFFDDVALDHAFYTDTAVTNATGVMTGYPTGDFGIDDNLNRAAVAVVMYRLLNKVQDLGIEDLMAYEGDIPEGQQPKSACSVLADNISSPNAQAPEVGDGYAKLNLFDELSLAALRGNCTVEVYEGIMQQYCAHGQNSNNQVQWGVLMYNENGDVTLGGGSSHGNQYRECPQEQLPKGACYITRAGLGAPDAHAAEIGDGFAKLHIVEDMSYAQVKNYCTDQRFDQLMESFCAHGQNSSTPVYWNVVTFNANGDVHTGGPAASGIQAHECPVEEEEVVVSCSDLAASSYTYPDTDGNKTVYFKSYGIYLCTAGNNTAVEIEPQNSGANYPKISGNHVVYFKSYGINLYNIATQQKRQMEPASSGCNSPAINNEYVAYFKSYGIYLRHIESNALAEIEPPNSGCNNPYFEGNVLKYRCNYVNKEFSLTTPGTPTKYIVPKDCSGSSSNQGNNCTMSDGGYNPSVRGTGQVNFATGVSHNLAEECRSGKLREWCCVPDGTATFIDMECANGCSGGACQ